MSDKLLKHFVIIRFFCRDIPRYKYDIFDVNFLSERALLSKNNLLRSLENQTNKNFEVVFILHEKVFLDEKYELISSELQNATTLPLKFIKWNEQSRLIKDALDKYDFVIQSRMDYDDFVYKDAVKDTQNKINECTDIIYYGYCRGYEYICGELFTAYGYTSGNGHHSTFPSLILNSSFAKKITPILICNFDHTKSKFELKESLEKNGIEFRENMFQQNLSAKAFIYFRHEFGVQLTVTNSTLKLPNRKFLTTKDVTRKELEEEFGFTGYKLNSIKGESEFYYDFKSITSEELCFCQDLTYIKWIK